jgi:hypothetical protein
MKSILGTSFFALLLTFSFSQAQSPYILIGETGGLMAGTGTLSDTCWATYRATGTGDSLYLDLNADGHRDFAVIGYNWFGTMSFQDEIDIYSYGSHSVASQLIGTHNLVKPFRRGDTLWATEDWTSHLRCKAFFSDGDSQGSYPSQNDSAYWGLRMESGGVVSLGWVRMWLDSLTGPFFATFGTHAVVYDWGAEFSPVSASESVVQKATFTLSPNPASTQVRLESHQPANWRIIDLQGRELMSAKGTRLWSPELTHLPQGIYLVECTVAGERGVKKLVVE